MTRTETVLLELAYDGSYFHGLAPQPGLRTVAGELRRLLACELHAEIRALTFSARTDAGVGAEQNYATFRVAHSALLQERLSRLSAATPAHAPVRVLSARHVPRSANARNSARGKLYRYRIKDGVDSPAFSCGGWELCPHLDVPRMNRAAALLIGEHDFSSFRAANCGASTPIKRVSRAEVRRVASEIEIWIAGDSFLRKMVRILVGTLAEVGAGLRSASSMSEVLAARQRSAAGVTAPARGLTLCQVHIDVG